MKHRFFLLGAMAVIGLFVAFSFDRAPVPVEIDENGVAYYDQGAGNSGAIYKPWTKDTITNAGSDVLTLPNVLSSPYQYAFQIRMTNISGTRNVKFYLEQTAATGSTRWMKVDSAITSGSAINDYLMRGANTYGNKLRISVVGSGTQSTAYQVDGLLKKTN